MASGIGDRAEMSDEKTTAQLFVDRLRSLADEIERRGIKTIGVSGDLSVIPVYKNKKQALDYEVCEMSGVRSINAKWELLDP